MAQNNVMYAHKILDPLTESTFTNLAGHLINEAYELAEAAAELQVGAALAFRAMTGFKFVHSPSIPGVVRFTARIADCTVRLTQIKST